jgi:hypothetical protein
MPAISFKFRPNGLTAQLVRHRYDKRIKRSRAVPVGALDRRADPDELPRGIELRDGHKLSEADMVAIRGWLLVNGDRTAMEERATRERRIEARVRAQLESTAHVSADPFTDAVEALERLGNELPRLVAATCSDTETAGRGLRPRYLEVFKAWESVFEAAKANGVTVTRAARARQSGS